MKTLIKLIASLSIIFSTTINGYSQRQITVPYNYPIKPGTDEWKKFQTQDEMIEACQIPEQILKSLTTEALVETCISYPLYPQITAYNNVQNGFDRFSTRFNGLGELMTRKDAGQALLRRYKAMSPSGYSPKWSDIQKGNFIYEYLFVEMLLAQEKIIAGLTAKKELIRESLKKYEEKSNEGDLFGLVGLSHTSYLMLKTLHVENDKDARSAYIADDKILAFQATANSMDFETFSKIRELAMNYLNR